MRRWGCVAGTVAVLALTGCGSTLQNVGAAPAGQTLGGTAPVPGATSGGLSGSGPAGSSDGGLSLPAGTSGTTGTGTAAAATGTGSTAPAGTVTGTGSAGSGDGGAAASPGDHAPIRVGFEIIQGGNEFISRGLGTPVNFGDGKEEVHGIVADVNRHGGVDGHPIQPFYGEWNAASGDNGREADCTKLTEDDHVSFIITVVNMSETYVACGARHNVPIINASLGAGDDALYAKYPQFLYTASLLSLNKEEQLVLDAGHDSGRVATTRKVGVVIDHTPPGDPQYGRVTNSTVVPMLKAWHVPYETFSVATQGDVSGAVLRFRADGVKTVLFVAPSGIIEILFMQAAEQQTYRPDYILGDSTAPWFIGQAAPNAQVQHITGVGALPLSDVPESQYATTPREKHCFQVIAAAGENNQNRHSSITATPYCEAINEFTAVASAVTGPLTTASYYAAYPTVKSFSPVTTFAIDFSTGKHTNAAEYRLLAYKSSCRCVAYSSGLRPVT